MKPVIPFPSSPSRNSFIDTITWQEDCDTGNSFTSSATNLYLGELPISTSATGTKGQGLKYSVAFDDCVRSWMAKATFNDMEATFKSKNGYKVAKRMEYVEMDQKSPTVEFNLSKNETERLVAGKSNDSIDVTVSAVLLESSGMLWCFTSRRNFFKKDENSTLVFHFADTQKKFYLDVEYLAHHSHFFHDLANNLHLLPIDKESGLPIMEWKTYKS